VSQLDVVKLHPCGTEKLCTGSKPFISSPSQQPSTKAGAQRIEVVAALLHNVPEDRGSKARLRTQIRLGRAVAKLVD
jgi:(p)ppGpp synthase/HD superfamily hydrolase